MYGEEAEGFDTKHAVFVSYSHTFLYRFLNLQAISPWKANQTPVPGHSLHKSANLMHRAHSAALWYTFLQPSFFSLSHLFFLSVFLLPETRILEVSRCLKAFCGLWQQQLMEICWVGALKCCSCLRRARPQLLSLAAWPLVKRRESIDWLSPTISWLFSFLVSLLRPIPLYHITLSVSF